jgi:hypothetical protein
MISSGRTIVAATPTQIDGNDINPVDLLIHNVDSTKDLYIGGANVSAANGFILSKGESIAVTIPPGNAIYMISSGDNHPVTWLRIAKY